MTGWYGFVLFACALLSVFALYSAYQLKKENQQLTKAMNERLAKLQRELDMVNSAAIGVGRRLMLTEKKLNASLSKQQQLEMQSADHGGFSQAVSMAEQGADVEQLVERYGLPEAEASLLSLLNSDRAKAG